MKINRLETHDRFQHFLKQDFDIAACCQDVIDKRPFGENPFYIFVHPRTDDDGVTKRLIWQPRLTKPKAQSNSMLFKAYPQTDVLKIIWMIPDASLWAQYRKGNVTESSLIQESIHNFLHNRDKLEEKESDDLSDLQIDAIYREISKGAKYQRI